MESFPVTIVNELESVAHGVRGICAVYFVMKAIEDVVGSSLGGLHNGQAEARTLTHSTVALMSSPVCVSLIYVGIV